MSLLSNRTFDLVLVHARRQCQITGSRPHHAIFDITINAGLVFSYIESVSLHGRAKLSSTLVTATQTYH